MKVWVFILVLMMGCVYSVNAEMSLVTTALGLSMLEEESPETEASSAQSVDELEADRVAEEERSLSLPVSAASKEPSSGVVSAELESKSGAVSITIEEELAQSADANLVANVVFGAPSVSRVRTNNRFDASFRKQKLPFIGKTIKLALTEDQNLMPEFTYGFAWGNLFSALSYESETLVTTGLVNDNPASPISKNREFNTLKVYPLNYAFRSRELGFSMGVLYVHRSSDRTEYGLFSSNTGSSEQLVNFNNEVLMNYQQLGFQASFLYQRKRYSVRSMFGVLPYNRLTVSENSLYRSVADDGNDITAKEKLGYAYTMQLDVLYRTSWYFDLRGMVSYDYWPSNYVKSVPLQNPANPKVSFESGEYDVNIGSAAIAFAILMPEISTLQLAPFVEFELRQYSEADNIAQEDLVLRNYAFSMGFSSKF